MLWTKDSDLELFVTFTDKDGYNINVSANWVTIEVKVGKAVFRAESNPVKVVDEETGEVLETEFENCYITRKKGVVGVMIVIPSESLDFGTVYLRTCTHEPNEHYADGYKDVWTTWMPCDLAVVTEKGFNQ